MSFLKTSIRLNLSLTLNGTTTRIRLSVPTFLIIGGLITAVSISLI